MELGPDGALYVVDMYRCVIEHPDFVPDELKRRPDLRLGDDRGRIWRIVPVRPARPERDLSRERTVAKPRHSRKPPATTSSLSSNIPTPGSAKRPSDCSSSAADPHITPAVREQIAGSEKPVARAHALWTLIALGALKNDDLTAVLLDESPALRRQGLLLAESLAAGQIDAMPLKPLLRDRSPTVRFQTRLTLTGSTDQVLGLPLGTHDLALSGIGGGGDPWLHRAALLFLGPDRTPETIQSLTANLEGSG